MSNEVLVPLPDTSKAPGVPDGIRDLAQWKFREVVDGWAAVEPLEGAGATYPYLHARRLCDADTQIDDATWEPLRRNPGLARREDVAALAGGPVRADWEGQLQEWADRLLEDPRNGAGWAWMRAKITALPPDDVPAFLNEHVPPLFDDYPDGSLWFVEADALLTRRFSLLRVLLALELMPDILDAPKNAAGELPQLRTLQEHSITSGIHFDSLIDPLLVVFPPSTIGFSIGWMPQSLVFLLGRDGGLIEKHPPTLASLYSPRLQSGFGFHWRESEFFKDLEPAHLEALLQWWVSRLNVVLSHALDPTQFADEQGHYRPTRQVAWFLTLERLLADSLAISSNPQGSGLVRQQSAFDLLDKAEVLLGYVDDSGRGFQRLLRRASMVKRLDEVWESRLPLQLRERFKRHTRRLYDGVYEEVRAQAYEHRLTPKGIKVWSAEEQRLMRWGWEQYVPSLIREVRNSAHGLLRQLEDEKSRYVLAAHSGELPAHLPELACLIAFALVADAESLCDGTWLKG